MATQIITGVHSTCLFGSKFYGIEQVDFQRHVQKEVLMLDSTPGECQSQ